MTDSQVYARRLLPKKHRYPMYYPEPLDNLPLEYRRRGVGIGDVGIIKPDGSFEFAFNIFIPWAESDREINCFGVPDGFVPMQLGRQPVASNQNKHAEGSVIMSNCEKSKDASGSIGVGDGFAPSAPAGTIGFDITSSSSETAVLTVPDGALGEDYYNKKAIRKFAITHALSWYEFINVELGREAPNGSLYVVTGCDRSTAWGIATVEKYSSSGSLSLQFTAIKGQLSASYSCSWSTTPGAVSRHSIAAEDFALGPDVKQPQNQCLFVRGYKVMVREGLMALQSPSELVAAESITDHSKSDSLLRQKDRSFPGTASGSKSWLSRIAGYQGGGKSNRESADGWSAEKELDPHVGAYHPLDSINSYLLDQTQAQIAITHESDWWALSPDETTPNESEIISRLATHYALSIESGGAFLTPIPNERSNAQSNDGSAIVLETERDAEHMSTSRASSRMPQQLTAFPPTYPQQRSAPRASSWMPQSQTAGTSAPRKTRELVDLTDKISREGYYPCAGGEFSDVWKGIWSDAQGTHAVAIKVIRVPRNDPAKAAILQRRLNRELRVWQRLKHKNVLLLYGTVASFGPCLSFVSPWLKNGSISNYVKTWGGDLGMANRLQLLCEVAAGLSYLHQSGVVHGDLTGANILIADDCSACLCDFGLSSIAAEFLGTSESFIPDNIRWAAPELYHVPKDGAVPMVSTHSDVYSYGSVAFEILSGRIPFEYLRDAQVIRQVFQGKKTPRPPSQNAPYVTDQLWAFMNQCWVEPPPDRPDVEQLLQSMQRFLGEID